MTDRPLLFSVPMVRALLAGTKTQTRRLLKPQPLVFETEPGKVCDVGVYHDEKGGHRRARVTTGRIITTQKIPCAIGDRLWVREAWRCNGWATDVATIFFRASEGDGYTAMCEQYSIASRKPLRVTAGWRPSIHMPRWASRLTLTVTDVRVERLQDISEEDALAEGMTFDAFARGDIPAAGGPIGSYSGLWDQINGPGSWEANPFVAAYSFTVERRNIDRGGDCA